MGAQDAPSETAGFANGRKWKLMTRLERMYFVVGYSNGVQFMKDLAVQAVPVTKSETEKLQFIHDSLIPAQLSVAETVDSLDKFYEEPTSALVPIGEMLCVVRMKTDGATVAHIEKRLAADREYWSKQ